MHMPCVSCRAVECVRLFVVAGTVHDRTVCRVWHFWHSGAAHYEYEYQCSLPPSPPPLFSLRAAKYNKSQFRYRGVSGTRPYGYWWNEISWPYNTITDGENVTQEALSDLLGIWDYIKVSFPTSQ